MFDQRTDKPCTHTMPPILCPDIHTAEFDGSTEVLSTHIADRRVLPPGEPEIAGTAQVHLGDPVKVPLVVFSAYIFWSSRDRSGV